MTVKTKYITALAVLLIGGLLYYFWYLGDKATAYEDIPDLYGEYTVSQELATAEAKYKQGVQPAIVYTKNPQVKAFAITFDGLPEPSEAAKLVDVVKKYDVNVTVFAEGSTAVEDKQTIQTLSERHIVLGNYTFSAVSKLQKVPVDSVLDQLVRTQKVLSVLTGHEPRLFKAPATVYTAPVLQAAAAAGLQGAVKTDVYVPIEKIKNDAAAMAFVATIPPGSVVSFVVTKPVNTVANTQGKTDERPAKDKQPGLKIRSGGAPDESQLVEVAERIFKAMQARGILSVPVTQLHTIAGQAVSIAQPGDASVPVKGASKVSLLARFVPTVYATTSQTALPGGVATPQSVASQKAVTLAQSGISHVGDRTDATDGRHRKAYTYDVAPTQDTTSTEAFETSTANSVMQEIPRMIYTTDPAVAFVYAGLTKPNVVYATLDFLKRNNSKGTFFVNNSEIRRNPQLIKDIIASGNEVGIGIRSLKDGNYTTVRKQIQDVRSRLAKMGVTTKLMMQPWGVITPDTVRAIKDEHGLLYRPTVTIVSSKQQHYTSPDAVMAERFGKQVYSVGRGWIISFRLDYYDDDSLVVNVMDLVKRHKIDTIAYHSFYDDPTINPHNDSAYKITSIGDILRKTNLLYSFNPNKVYSTNGADYVRSRSDTFNQFISNRYIGNMAVQDDNMYGFTVEQKRFRDITGRIRTQAPVVFFTFDDFGNDSAINPILYVLRKHHVAGTFFVLTHNVMDNPNIVRAIAMDGNDIGSHSEYHRAMDATPYNIAYPRYLVDYGIANAKLYDIVGDLYRTDGTPLYHPYFRPPTLTASRAGFQALFDTGYTYIVSGSYSTHDYMQPDLKHMIEAIKEGLYDTKGHVNKGAILVMHMSNAAIYTAVALDMILTANERLPDGDPAKFVAMPLSAYLRDGYSQGGDGNPETTPVGAVHDDSMLYTGTGY